MSGEIQIVDIHGDGLISRPLIWIVDRTPLPPLYAELHMPMADHYSDCLALWGRSPVFAAVEYIAR